MVGFQFDKVVDFLPQLLAALPLTLAVLFLSVFFGSGLGLLLAWAQLSQDLLANRLSRSYIFVMRCTPPLVLIFLVFYGLPEFLLWWLHLDINQWPQTVFTVVAMTLLHSATVAEVFKAAYLAIPIGQMEAGLSIGLTGVQTLVRIICPQALRVALPNLANGVLTLLKDIALAYTIGLVDVMGASHLLIGRNVGNYSLETYTAAAVIYWGLSFLLTVSFARSERFLSPVARTS